MVRSSTDSGWPDATLRSDPVARLKPKGKGNREDKHDPRRKAIRRLLDQSKPICGGLACRLGAVGKGGYACFEARALVDFPSQMKKPFVLSVRRMHDTA